jgi:hypothetical protein
MCTFIATLQEARQKEKEKTEAGKKGRRSGRIKKKYV